MEDKISEKQVERNRGFLLGGPLNCTQNAAGDECVYMNIERIVSVHILKNCVESGFLAHHTGES
jgi:hypothetical protein